MRFDNVGMFWEDIPLGRGKNRIARTMPAIPDTGWTPPTDFPNLQYANVLAIDTETWDPELVDHQDADGDSIPGKGPGWARNKGHVVGISLATDDGHKWYYPVRHTVEPEYNLNPENVFAWLRDILNTPRIPKVGANILYDVGWLRHEGVTVAGELIDVQYAEALLDESARVALENLAQRYLGRGKETNFLYKWCSDFYGGEAGEKQRSNIHRAPPRLVGPYAEADASLPLHIIRHQWPRLQREGLLDLFRIECELIRLYIEMRWQGVRVDIAKAEQLRDYLAERETLAVRQLDLNVGFGVNVNAADSLARAFDHLGVPYGRTKPTKRNPTGRPSFTKDFLENVEHPIGDVIREIRRVNKLRTTFVESYILDSHINGKIYCQFHPLRGDKNGTRSGRLSSSTPNLQNIPVRDKELAPRMRGIFIFDDGHEAIRRYDYSQIEYRFLAHFAVGMGSEEVRARYRDDPLIDYHDMTGSLIQAMTQMILDRVPLKTINFGLIYGMGKPKLTRSLHLARAEGERLFAAYHRGVPFAKATMDSCMEEAQRTGIITTILNRKSRFDLWEPYDQDEGVALPYNAAIHKYSRIKRAYTHKALNRKLQGSAADLMKMAMLYMWRSGVFAYTGVPRLTVHDELVFSDPGAVVEAFAEVHRIMESAMRLLVPIRAKYEIGPDWGHCAAPH